VCVCVEGFAYQFRVENQNQAKEINKHWPPPLPLILDARRRRRQTIVLIELRRMHSPLPNSTVTKAHKQTTHRIAIN